MKRLRSILLIILVLNSVISGCLIGSDSGEDSDDGRVSVGEYWKPAVGTTWQWQLSGELNQSFDVVMYDIDLFDTSVQNISELQRDGKIVICYFSAGSYEEYREDSPSFPNKVIGEPLTGWYGEWWLDLRAPIVREIMSERLNLAVEKGCDGVEPDNVDGYTNNNGFELTAADQLDYNIFIAKEAHKRNLSVGLKNDLEQISDLVNYFDWALNEECIAYEECELNQPFIDAGKSVFHVEYVDNETEGEELANSVCESESLVGHSTLIKTWDLSDWAIDCYARS